MSNNHSTSQKAVFTLIILAGAILIYAVYFTELGKPQSSDAEKQFAIYNQPGMPTIFVEASQAPSASLNWAYANKETLKFAVNIHGLTIDIDPTDIICNPYIRIAEPVQQRISGHEIRSIYDADGQAIEVIYEYEISANAHSLLTIEMDLTIGPCADYLNFQETNITPSTPPDLISNYHFNFQVPVR